MYGFTDSKLVNIGLITTHFSKSQSFNLLVETRNLNLEN